MARAAASLTPSPTMATTRPLLLQVADHVDLVLRQHLGDHVVVDARPRRRPRARPAALSPVSSTGRSPSARSSATASATGRLHRVGHHRGRPRGAVPADRDRGATRLPAPPSTAAAGSSGRDMAHCSASHAGAGRRRRAVARSTARRTPSPGWRGSRRRRRAPAAAALGRAAAAIARAIGCSEASSTAPGQAQHLGPGVQRRAAVTRRPACIRPVGDGAGLVQHDGVDPPGRLQHLGALDQDAQLGAATGADQQGGRRGQAQGARAGDDQHRDGGGERRRRAVARCPASRRGWPGTAAMTTGTNTAETRSASRCTGALPVWASVDQPGHLGQLGVGADPGGAHDQPAAGVDGGADHRVARADLDRDATRRSASRRRPRRSPSTTTPSVAIFSPGRTTNVGRPRAGRRSGSAPPRRRAARRRPWRPGRAARAGPPRSGAWPGPRGSGPAG